MLKANISRRDALLAFGASIGTSMLIKPVSAVDRPAQSALRVVHLTDMHVKPEKRAAEGFAAALESLKLLNPQPDFLVTGGDHVMDVLNCTPERANEQWSLYHKTLEQGTRLRVYPVVGNHDVYGWSTKPALPESDAQYGKAMSRDMLRVERTYYSFEHGAWHFIVLDNIQKRGGGHYGDLEPAQLEWLKADLQTNASRKPIMLFSHIPLASIVPLFFHREPKEFWRTSDGLLHRNSRPLIELLAQYNTRLCVSGHIHLLDELRMMNVNFVCNGAVSGSWWGGPHQWVPEGYGVFDLYDDGTHQFQYVTYDWQAAT
ncbi:MAG TPA: metallophosphoesterase [Tepidisphaeraceae bacterium]|nr:metallophosphoesterase [Tepidisphaeraceae bacterium]